MRIRTEVSHQCWLCGKPELHESHQKSVTTSFVSFALHAMSKAWMFILNIWIQLFFCLLNIIICWVHSFTTWTILWTIIWTVHPKVKILSPFTHPNVIPGLSVCIANRGSFHWKLFENSATCLAKIAHYPFKLYLSKVLWNILLNWLTVIVLLSNAYKPLCFHLDISLTRPLLR